MGICRILGQTHAASYPWALLSHGRSRPGEDLLAVRDRLARGLIGPFTWRNGVRCPRVYSWLSWPPQEFPWDLRAAPPTGFYCRSKFWGADGTTVSRTFTLQDGQAESVRSLWLQIHGLRYADQASVQVNTSAWIPLNNNTVTIPEPARSFVRLRPARCSQGLQKLQKG